jgi:acyl-coenzyme A synthetase/AMP-(fatty) acid ligase
MLYELWRKVAAARHNELALRDGASGRRWSFVELLAAGEARSRAPGEMVFPQGNSPEFLLDLLAAWREGKIVCPLEPDQSPPQIPLPPEPCVHLKTTSATTGTARLAAFTAEQLAADAENIVATMELRADWPNLGVISIAHSYGFSNLILPLLLHGIPLILAPSPLPEAVRRAADGERALTLPAVPAMWRAWHEANAIPPGVCLAISAGAPLPVELERAVFATRRLKIHNFYGSTECGGIAYDTSETPRCDGAFVGEAIRNVDLSINADGCLAVRSRAVAQTYWPASAGNLGAGLFQTSDLAEVGAGKVFLRGRTGDLINVAGRKISPLIIEQALARHPDVRACLVFGAPDRDAERNDLIVAAVVAKAAVSGEALRKFLLEKIPAWQIPRDWWFVESLEANRVGKISRAEWRRRYLERQ